eukprot:Gb_31558 [translate_table: standard]
MTVERNIMHGLLSPLFTILTALFLVDRLSQSIAAGYYEKSCGPCGVKYVTSESEQLEDIARKCGFAVKILEKYREHTLAAGSIIRIPCLTESATYTDSLTNYVQPESFLSLHRQLEEKSIFGPPKISIYPSTDLGSISQENSTASDLDTSSFIGCGICGNTYEPNVGDTIKSIAQYCNISEAVLTKENPNMTDQNIMNSQAINISCTGADQRNNCTICGSWHQIKMSETLYVLANSCNITLISLENANLGIDWDNVYPGQYINVPCENPNLTVPLDQCGPCGIQYRAQKEVDIQEITKTCAINTTDLIALNPSLEGKTKVSERQTLRISCGHGTCGQCGFEFVTYQNEGLKSLAARCHVGTIALQLKNPGVKFQGGIPNNTTVKIPCNNQTKPGPLCSSKCSPSFTVENDTDVNTISKMCNVSIDLILYANNIKSLNEPIHRGRTIDIPCASVPAQTQRTCSICGSSLELKAFVKLEALAVLCNTTSNAIKIINPSDLVLDEPGPGDALLLPCESIQTGCGPCGSSYVTERGDSLQSVAVKCATMAEDIQSANPSIDFQSLNVDFVLDIPCSLPGILNLIWHPDQLLLADTIEIYYEGIISRQQFYQSSF